MLTYCGDGLWVNEREITRGPWWWWLAVVIGAAGFPFCAWVVYRASAGHPIMGGIQW